MVQLSFNSIVRETPIGHIEKVYTKVTPDHLRRLLDVYRIFDELNLGPHIISFQSKPGILLVTMEKVIPISDYLPEHPEERDTILKKAVNLCDRIHAADWVHGDFYPMNIGIRDNGEVIVFDLDTVISISTGANEPWITEMIEGNYGDIPFEEYVRIDYECIEGTIDDAVTGAFRD